MRSEEWKVRNGTMGGERLLFVAQAGNKRESAISEFATCPLLVLLHMASTITTSVIRLSWDLKVMKAS